MMLASIRTLTLRAARLASLPERPADSDMVVWLLGEALEKSSRKAEINKGANGWPGCQGKSERQPARTGKPKRESRWNPLGKQLVFRYDWRIARQGYELMFEDMDAAISYIFRSRRRLDAAPRGLDEYTRDTAPTRSLLDRAGLLQIERDYAVVTGSRGKGSVTAIMSKLLQARGRRVGTITSPHLVHWNERIRVDGRMIPSNRFLHILNDLRPAVDATLAGLDAAQYLSPQGVFLAIALQHFAEMDVDVAVLEVGRGGRYDDISVVPNRLSVFAPIMLEHTALLGDSVRRIARHKAGIIKPGGAAISLPQAPAALSELRREAEKQAADLICLRRGDMAEWLADKPDGQLMRLPPYGELRLPCSGVIRSRTPRWRFARWNCWAINGKRPPPTTRMRWAVAWALFAGWDASISWMRPPRSTSTAQLPCARRSHSWPASSSA